MVQQLMVILLEAEDCMEVAEAADRTVTRDFLEDPEDPELLESFGDQDVLFHQPIRATCNSNL